LLDQGSSEASELSLPSVNGRSSGESKKTIGFSEEVEVQSPEQPCSPATASMDFQETEEWQAEAGISSVGCNQAHDTTFPRPSSDSPGQIDRSRALSTTTREVSEMQDQLQMASIRRRSLRVSAVINQLDLNLDEDNWHRGVSTGSVLLPTEDWVREKRPSKDWVRGVSVGSKSASHSGSPTEERQKRKKEKKKTLFAHEGDENQEMKERARTLAAARDKSAAEHSFSAQLGSPITRFERLRYRMRRFLGSPSFEVFVGCLVASNAVIIGMEAFDCVKTPAQHMPSSAT
ncbi:scn4ab, partial [Symbiodinium sp. CCMP2456]